MVAIDKNVEFLDRNNGIDSKHINIIFRCKDDCKTIFTLSHIEEMLRFTAHAVDNPLWAHLCIRENPKNIVFVADSSGCSDKSYQNLTKTVELNVRMGIISDEMIQAQINATSQYIHELPEIRQLLDF